MISTAVLARAIPMNEGEERDDILKCEKMKQLSRMPTSSGSRTEQKCRTEKVLTVRKEGRRQLFTRLSDPSSTAESITRMEWQTFFYLLTHDSSLAG